MFKIINTKNYIKVSNIQDAIELRKKIMEMHKDKIKKYISKLNTNMYDDNDLGLEANTASLQFWIDRLKEDREVLNELKSVLESN